MICYTNKHRIPFQIDAEFFDLVKIRKWKIVDGYVCNTMVGYLHIHLFGYAPIGFMWDHKNRDRLDNRRENLRHVTATVNVRNSNGRGSSSGYKGVYYYPKNNWYVAQITVMGKIIRIGTFHNLEEAIAARQKAELQYWGDQK